MSLLRNILIVFCLAFALSGCLPTANPNLNESVPYGEQELDRPAGILEGGWHGFMIVFSAVSSTVDPTINIYEVHNDGARYNFAFIFGIIVFIWTFSSRT